MRHPHSLLLLWAMLLCMGCTGTKPHKPLMGGVIEPPTRYGESQKTNARNALQTLPDDSMEVPASLADRPEQILRRTGYTVSYNRERRLANWVAWHLTASHVGGQYKRQGVPFMEDDEVPAPRATTYDYQRSGYDRGHMCPSADNKWSDKAQQDCFLFTNICPQTHGLNGGDWNDLEMACRRWAKTYGDLYIVCGPVLGNQKYKTIGRNKITVPEVFFKVVLCLQGEPKALGFLYQNADGDQEIDQCLRSVDEIERLTGIDFFPALDDRVEQRVEAEIRITDWAPAIREGRR